jgi:hypothetical protein
MKVLQAMRQLNRVGAAKRKMEEIFVYATRGGKTVRYPVEAVNIFQDCPGVRADMERGEVLVDGVWKPYK